LPSDSEWLSLLISLTSSDDLSDDQVGESLKSITGWNNGGNGTDEFGFSALPAGFRHYNGVFDFMGKNVFFWSSTEYDSSGACRMYMYSGGRASLNNADKNDGFSVRCLQD